MKTANIAILVLACSFPISLFAQNRNGKRTVQEFKNVNCKENQTCSLRGARLVVEDWDLSDDDGPDFMTVMHAQYETSSVEEIEKYVFVQFLKGCMYKTRIEKGNLIVEYPMGMHFGKGKPFKFNDWTIDAVDSDPVYSSSGPGFSRFSNLFWNKVPGSFSKRTEEEYTPAHRPKIPIVYIEDKPHPGRDLYEARHYREAANVANASVKFRTCIYKAADVPPVLEPGELKFARPIHCFEWSSSFVYNHETKKLESPLDIVPQCKE